MMDGMDGMDGDHSTDAAQSVWSRSKIHDPRSTIHNPQFTMAAGLEEEEEEGEHRQQLLHLLPVASSMPACCQYLLSLALFSAQAVQAAQAAQEAQEEEEEEPWYCAVLVGARRGLEVEVEASFSLSAGEAVPHHTLRRRNPRPLPSVAAEAAAASSPCHILPCRSRPCYVNK